MNDDISDLRLQIDAIDDSLLDLLNRRAEFARQVGEAKKQGVIYRPEREAQVHRRLHETNNGPLSNDTVSYLFTEIISSCRAEEELLSIACLGPAGTFSEEAVVRQFGSQVCQSSTRQWQSPRSQDSPNEILDQRLGYRKVPQ